jgi:hypothetical protein
MKRRTLAKSKGEGAEGIFWLTVLPDDGSWPKRHADTFAVSDVFVHGACVKMQGIIVLEPREFWIDTDSERRWFENKIAMGCPPARA